MGSPAGRSSRGPGRIRVHSGAELRYPSTPMGHPRGVQQGVLTVVAQIADGRLAELDHSLRELETALDLPRGAPLVDFRSLDTVHFARFAVLPPDSFGRQHLLFSTAYDGPRALHLAELVKRVRPGLCAVFEHCTGFPSEARTSPATFLAYLAERDVPYGAMHVGYVGRTVKDIRDEAALRDFLGGVLDSRGAQHWEGRSARAVRGELIRQVAESPLAPLLQPRAATIAMGTVEGWWKNPLVVGLGVLGLFGAGLAAFLVNPLVGAGYVIAVTGGAAAIVFRLRHLERTEPAKMDSDVEQGLHHAEDEDFEIRNQITHIVDVKPTAFRLALLKFVLLIVNVRARIEFFKGDLDGIETIHCAHWAIIEPDGKGAWPRLLFVSNYDGSWERYLGDFIEEAGGGMTSVWSNTKNYPRACFLLWGGAAHERAFKAWTRERQVETQVWYAAWPDVSIRNVAANSQLRDGLRGGMAEEEARRWLTLL